MIADAVLAQIVPSNEEREAVEETIDRLVRFVQGALDGLARDATATVQGSIAKDTWHKGAMDVDLFVLFPTDTSAEHMTDVVRQAGESVLLDPKQRYAQHPYIVGQFDGLTVDLVPAYAIEDPAQKMSAVDRTPFHTEWVVANLNARRRADVRLAKQWLKGIGAYGAETAIAGFSGYLVEVLVCLMGSFDGVIAWLAGGAEPRRITGGRDQVDDDVSPLVVVDPVDPTRNCAAAISLETLALCKDAARAYQRDPSLQFFFPNPPEAQSPESLQATLAEHGDTWVGWVLPDAPERLDIVYPQFKKAAERIAQSMRDAGFGVRATDTWTDERCVCMQWLLDAEPLPERKRHSGPPADLAPNADRFRAKWDHHPDADGGVREVDGRLQVDVLIRDRTPAEWLGRNLAKMPLGKHVERCRPKAALLTDLAAVPSPWSPHVTDFILGRRPWER